MASYNIVMAYFAHARKMFGVRGIMLYDGNSYYKLMVAGWPHARAAANNDNEVKP